MVFAIKVVVSAVLISFASWLSGKKPVLAGFIIALPLASLISLVFSYAEYRNMDKLNQYALSILVAVPLSLAFFIPFVLNRWFKMNFPLTMASAVGLLAFRNEAGIYLWSFQKNWDELLITKARKHYKEILR